MRLVFIAILGIQIFATNLWAGDGFDLTFNAVTEPLENVLQKVNRAERLGATHFNIQLLFCQRNRTANEVRWCAPDVQNYKARALILARELTRRGFTIGFLPMLLSDDGAWRGFFEPTDFASWSSSYLARLDEMVELALAAKVSDFIVATELVRLFVAPSCKFQSQRTEFWRRAYSRVKAKLGAHVTVVIVANWDQFEQIPFWDASDVIGLSAYYPLIDRNSDDTSLAKLIEGWRKWQRRLVALAERNKKRLYFSEVGYASESNAAREPWDWNGTLDLELQARLYVAFGTVWAQDKAMSAKLSRFLLWALDISPDPQKDSGFSVIGKPAEQPLNEIFKMRKL